MHRGGKTLLIGAGFATAACTTGSSTLQVRAIPNPAAKLGRGASDLDTARSYLALGSVGLALEGFRKVQREQPANAQAFAGIAACYQAMSRYDLAQQNYEAALAVTPDDPSLLLALAAVFDRQAMSSQAAQARADAARINSSKVSAATPTRPLPTSIVTPRAGAPKYVAAVQSPQLVSSVTVDLPRAVPASAVTNVLTSGAATEIPEIRMLTEAPALRPPQLSASVTVDLPPARPADVSKDVLTKRAAASIPSIEMQQAPPLLKRPQLRTLAAVDLVPVHPARAAIDVLAAITTAAIAPIKMPEPAPAASITVALPPATMVSRSPASPKRPPIRAVEAEALAPRLERLSRGEVALITTGKPMWQAKVATRPQISSAVRWIPIQSASARPNIQILNAARRQGIAAQARNVLLGRGWRRIAIGDAPLRRETSVVMYPAQKAALGRSLAAQFGFRAQMTNDTNVLVVLLGLDAPKLHLSAVRG